MDYKLVQYLQHDYPSNPGPGSTHQLNQES